jgi:replicative DNA helicase
MKPDDVKQVELSLLAGMLRWNDGIGDVIDAVRAEDFYAYHHRVIFTAILHLWDQGRPVDVEALADELQRRGQVQDVGGYGYLADLLQREPTGANSVHHAGIVHEQGLIRRLNAAAQQIVHDTAKAKAPAEELLQDAERAIYSLAETGYASRAVRLGELVEEVFERIDRRARKGGPLSGLPTGLIDLDAKTAGLHDADLIVLAARPSVGKTALALGVAGHLAIERGVPAYIASLEMSGPELTERLLCAWGRVDGHRLRKGTLTKEDADRLVDARARLADVPLFIDDTPNQSMLHIAATARRLKRREKIKLVVIDYLQLIEPENRRDPRHEQVAQVSRRLKGLAKELQLPVLALAQLSRASEEAERPRLSHLRESGAIEADADVVLLMHRPADARNTVDLIIAKQRNGPVGEVTLAFSKEFCRFENYAAGQPPLGGG